MPSKSQSWVNVSALSLSNTTLVISFARNQNLLNKIHLMKITRIHTAPTNPTAIKYKFGIHVPKGIKNAINLDKKNGNNLWEEAIKTKLKQLTDYEIFIVLDSGEDISKALRGIKIFHIT
jgi:hypothetical protein